MREASHSGASGGQAAQSLSPIPLTGRVLFLDGVRGLAALFVVVHHLHLEITYRQDVSPLLMRCTRWLQLGHYAVAVFIVLSGYSLMLPLVRRGDARVEFAAYLKRRARRILPPYYLAIAFTLALVACIPEMRRPMNLFWDASLPALDPGAILSHLFLIHNLFPQWALKIDPPMWSVATEWQIYFFFPLVLLPVYRRFGSAATAIFGYVLGLLIARINGGAFGPACPWYLGLFAIGMASAAASVHARRPRSLRRAAIVIGVIATFAWAALVKLRPWMLPETDLLAGLAAGALLTWCTIQSTVTGMGRAGVAIMRLLESSPAVFAGTISYSLYLIHQPIMAAVHVGLIRFGWDAPSWRPLILPLAAVPAIAVGTLAFFVVAERPFLPGRGTTWRRTSVSTAISPAP